MGQPGNAARAADQGDRLGPGEPGLGDLRRAAVAEVAGERLATAGDLPGPHQPVGQVPTAERGAGEGAAQGLQVDRQAQPVEPLGHRARAARRAAARRRVAAASSAGSSSRTKWPRMWTSRPSCSAVSSTPAISSTPSRSASGRATARAETRVVVGDRQRRQADRRPRRGPPRRASRRRRSGSCGRAGRPPAAGSGMAGSGG